MTDNKQNSKDLRKVEIMPPVSIRYRISPKSLNVVLLILLVIFTALAQTPIPDAEKEKKSRNYLRSG